MSQSSWLFLIALTVVLESNLVQSTECHSCIASCKILSDGRIDINNCDCTGNTTCSAQNCFVKVELFSAESVAIVQVIILI
jgi:hypothetical protein